MIIELHRLGQWSRLCKLASVIVPRIIAEEEVQYYVTSDSFEPKAVAIDLGEQALQGLFVVEEATTSETASVTAELDSITAQGLHPGETEALAVLRRSADYVFCTADELAVKALTYLGLPNQGMSLEGLLRSVSLSTKNLAGQFTEECYRGWTRKAGIFRVQGLGSAKDLLKR